MQVGRQGEAVAGLAVPQQNARQHAPLGAVEAGPVGGVGPEFFDVIRKQVVQEHRGVIADGVDLAQVRHRHHDVAVARAHHVNRRFGTANDIAVEMEVGACEKLSPVIHDGLHTLGAGMNAIL